MKVIPYSPIRTWIIDQKVSKCRDYDMQASKGRRKQTAEDRARMADQYGKLREIQKVFIPTHKTLEDVKRLATSEYITASKASQMLSQYNSTIKDTKELKAGDEGYNEYFNKVTAAYNNLLGSAKNLNESVTYCIDKQTKVTTYAENTLYQGKVTYLDLGTANTSLKTAIDAKVDDGANADENLIKMKAQVDAMYNRAKTLEELLSTGSSMLDYECSLIEETISLMAEEEHEIQLTIDSITNLSDLEKEELKEKSRDLNASITQFLSLMQEKNAEKAKRRNLLSQG